MRAGAHVASVAVVCEAAGWIGLATFAIGRSSTTIQMKDYSTGSNEKTAN